MELEGSLTRDQVRWQHKDNNKQCVWIPELSKWVDTDGWIPGPGRWVFNNDDELPVWVPNRRVYTYDKLYNYILQIYHYIKPSEWN